MKLYCIYTKSHQVFKDEWFNPPQDEYEVIFEKFPQLCPSGEFMQQGWIELMHRKVDYIIQKIQENRDEVFICSDIDMQFFKESKRVIEQLIDGKDMLIQRNSPNGVLCAGFFACRGNDKTLALWRGVKEGMTKYPWKNDQDALNTAVFRQGSDILNLLEMLGNQITNSDSLKNICNQFCLRVKRRLPNSYQVLWEYLPVSFYSAGALTGKVWSPGEELPLPRNVILHHANWAAGIANKIAQLKYVRDKIKSRTADT